MKVSHEREERLLRAALEAKDYRSFIATTISLTTKEGAKPNIAAVSRKAGFSSRSFIGDVIDGRRRLSSASLPKIAKALNLPTRLKTYFHLLVIREEEKLNIDRLKTEQIESKLADLRSRFKSQLQTSAIEEKAVNVMFKGRDMLDCYAALGSPEKGASLEEISRRTGIPLEVGGRLLQHFLARGIATEKDGRYFSGNAFLFFKDIGGNEGAKSCYLQTMDELKRKANASFHAKDRAFFQFVFSVDQSRMPELKQKLWELMQEFVESNESTDGNTISKLLLGFYT